MTLIVMSGLPGSGKTRLGTAMGRRLGCALVSVDTIERGLHEAAIDPGQPVGLAAYAVAARGLESRDHELRAVPWERVQALRDGWTRWPVPTTVIDTAAGEAVEAVVRRLVASLPT
jgi:hypothetical protein